MCSKFCPRTLFPAHTTHFWRLFARFRLCWAPDLAEGASTVQVYSAGRQTSYPKVPTAYSSNSLTLFLFHSLRKEQCSEPSQRVSQSVLIRFLHSSCWLWAEAFIYIMQKKECGIQLNEILGFFKGMNYS